MNPAHRSRRKVVFGSAVVAILVLLGMLTWAPESVPVGSSTRLDGATPEGLVGSVSRTDREAERSVLSPVDREAVSASPGIPTGATSLTVRVVRRDTGDAVPGFWVTVAPEEAMSAPGRYQNLEGVTDERGEVFWENLEWNRVAVAPAQDLDWFDLERGTHNERIHEIGQSFTIDGEVVDPSGQAVAGAEIWTFLGNISYSGLTEAGVSDGAGRFSLPILESDRLFVFARAEGRGPSRVAWVSRSGDTESVELRLAVGDGAGTILGEVVSPDGLPIADARIRVHHSTFFLPAQEDANMRMGRQEEPPVNPPQRTDAEGRFRLEDVSVGEASVLALAEGWAGAVSKVDVAPGSTSRVRITLSLGARVRGTVRDTEGKPVSGVLMEGRRHSFATRRTVTDLQGRYLLENVQPGQVMLEAVHPTRGRADEFAQLEDGEELVWEPVFSAGKGVRGVISDREGVPMPGLRGSITGEDGDYRPFQTDAEGFFHIDHCVDQEYEIKVMAPGFSMRVSVASGVRPGGEDLDLRLPELPVADSHVTGRLVGPLGQPVSAVSIYGQEEELGSYVTLDLSAPDGRFRLGPMISGTWRFRFDVTGYPLLERTFMISAEKVTDLGEIRFEAAVPVEIAVRRPAGAEGSIAGYLWGPGFDRTYVRIDSGRAVLPPLPAGSYRLQIVGEEVPWEVREFELVSGQETRLQIDLQLGVPRSLQVVLPDGVESSVLTFSTFDASGQELVSWRTSWYSGWSSSPLACRPEAVRLVVTDPDARRGEADLSGESIRVVLRFPRW